jgi:tRNA 2-thiouridine synthesizing protein A
MGQEKAAVKIDVRLDLSGLKCPMPALLLERALRNAPDGAVVMAIATDPMAEVDLPYSAGRLGAAVLAVSVANGVVTVTAQKGTSGGA